jgi:predicted nuclease of predicted toxin-antitoxin system
MKLLIDENLPHKLRYSLDEHACFTATYMGWNGISNGELLRIAAANGFDAVISNDRGLEYQQNQEALPLSVVVLLAKDNKLRTIESMVPALIAVLNDLKPRTFVKVQLPE